MFRHTVVRVVILGVHLLAATSADRRAGALFLVGLLIATSIWWAVMRRRQSWWYGLGRRPRDITGERWIRSTEVRADKPMPERSVVVERRGRRR
ncbi:MAG: hypothetical protein ACO3FC_07180 [Ilumatobacteraceae bacterium]